MYFKNCAWVFDTGMDAAAWNELQIWINKNLVDVLFCWVNKWIMKLYDGKNPVHYHLNTGKQPHDRSGQVFRAWGVSALQNF